MPITPNGTAWTLHSADLGVHGMCYWGVADEVAGDSDIPLMLFAHGTGGAANTFATGSSSGATRNWVIDNGWAFVEGTGGITDNWGNQAARDAYSAYLDLMATVLLIGIIVLNGRSMGNLVCAWLAAKSGREFAGYINNFGVGTVKVSRPAVPESPGVEAVPGVSATAYNWRKQFAIAYGITGPVDGNTAWFNQIPDDFCPETWPAEVWAGVNILSRYGGMDSTVPWSVRGMGPVANTWAGQPAIDQVKIFPTDEHSSAAGNADISDIAAFLTEVTGGTVEPEPPPTYFEVLSEWILIDGKFYECGPPPTPVPES